MTNPSAYGIESNSVEHWKAFYGALITETGLLYAGKTAYAHSINLHSTAGSQQISGLPENVAMSQGAMNQVSVDNFIRTRVPESFQENVREAFASDIKVTTLTEDLVVYRYYGGTSQPSSFWYTPYQYEDPISSLALPPLNTADRIATSIIPAGTTILEGHVAPMPQWGQPGGGYQIYVPDPSVILP